MHEKESQSSFKATEELKHILGQASVQVQEAVNQCIISDKNRLGQILEQISVQVWDKSKVHVDKHKLCLAVIDTLSLLHDTPFSAKSLNATLEFGEIYELKRRILLPLMRLGYIGMTDPSKPTSAKQAYKLTQAGESLFSRTN